MSSPLKNIRAFSLFSNTNEKENKYVQELELYESSIIKLKKEPDVESDKLVYSRVLQKIKVEDVFAEQNQEKLNNLRRKNLQNNYIKLKMLDLTNKLMIEQKRSKSKMVVFVVVLLLIPMVRKILFMRYY